MMAYHAGRLVSYAVVGVASGELGVVLQEGGALVGVQQSAALVAGIVVAIWGVAMLMSHAAPRAGRTWVPAFVQSATTRIMRSAMKLSPVGRAAMLGLATPLLPCGWLWAFAVVAAGTASALSGAVVMIAFCLGTMPVLALIGTGIHALGTRQRQLVGALAGVAMIAVGLHTAFVRADKADLVAHALAERTTVSGDPTDGSAWPGDEVPACCQVGPAADASRGKR